ncbi:TonB-dependent receptor [Sphingomonas parva]|uniref:TonB-dependent receptor n=1 Tax=Sphingomonas parva TaxID=2555898 RepID=A0A4Y8ZS40_9SPHN|nr:TonB-dependent receptor [Sphingomonas parva]TFI57226.1 TonB-dependent receptor [Sphingomonas parva]
MARSFWLMSAGIAALAASPAYAQDNTPEGQEQTPDTALAAPTTEAEQDQTGAIIITATRRASPLADVPVAVSAVTAETMQNSGASDLRQLNQVTPSLYVSSTSSEAGAGGAGIRGIRTVGDNPGLESSVATFIDGVYRSRAGIGLTELGPVERVEILRGPQGTLFGRNASAGLINVVTARPRRDQEAYGEASYGNFDYYRLGAGITGPLTESLAYRVDGIYLHRDGFLKDVISGRRVNNRDRYLVRGKLLFEPSDDVSLLVTGDYTKRDEECCAATYLPARDAVRNANGQLTFAPSSTAAIIRNLTSVVPGAGKGQILDDTFARRIAITPGRDFRSDVEDWGLSAEATIEFGPATLTSITGYRDYHLTRGLDGDFNNLDIIARAGDGDSFNDFKTFTQELRLQGTAFDGVLDWLVGGYYADETLKVGDNIEYGADYNQFAAARVAALSPALGAFPLFGFQNLNGFTQAFVNSQLATNPAFAAVPAFARPLVVNAIASQVVNVPLSGAAVDDLYEQKSRNFALFTHNIFNVTDRLSVTLGARFTSERKSLDAELNSTSSCGAYVANINRLRALAAGAAANPGGNGGLNAAIAGLAGALAAPGTGIYSAGAPLVCVINSVNGSFSDRKKESEWSGTAVLSYKATDDLLVYGSYSRGYKAGGFNLDRAPLFSPVTLASTNDLDVLKFDPEKVDAFEIGAKFDGRRFDLNVAAFYQMFKSFQLNTFDGTNFFVTDIRGCKNDLGTTDEDLTFGNSICSETRSGVVSRGVELEAFMYPAPDFTVSAGFTLADTRYRRDLAGTPSFYQPANGNSLIPALFLLPGSRLSNAPEYVVTGSASWTPEVSSNLRGLLYADFRYQSEFNTGSDLFPEKVQEGVMVVNARAGIGASDRSWSLELWAQNLFDVDYKQVAFNATLQGSNTSYAQTAAFGTPATQLFGAFLAEPRTYGITGRFRF